MGEKVIIQSAHFMKYLRPDKHACAGCPKDFPVIIILPIVLLDRLENPAAAEGVSILIDEASGGPCIFKLLRVVERKNFRLAGGDVGIFFHQLNDGWDPVFRYVDIGIQQDIIICFDLAESQVITAGKAMIFIEANDPDAGKLLLQEFNRTIGGRIVSNDDFCIILAEFDNSGKELFQVLLPIPVQYNNSYFQQLDLAVKNRSKSSILKIILHWMVAYVSIFCVTTTSWADCCGSPFQASQCIWR